MHDGRISVTIWEYRDVQNWLFACLEGGKMETNYLAITLHVSSTNMSRFCFYQWTAGHDDALSINRSINLIIDYFSNWLINFNRLIVAAPYSLVMQLIIEMHIAHDYIHYVQSRKYVDIRTTGRPARCHLVRYWMTGRMTGCPHWPVVWPISPSSFSHTGQTSPGRFPFVLTPILFALILDTVDISASRLHVAAFLF